MTSILEEVTIPSYFSGGSPTTAERDWDAALGAVTALLEANGMLSDEIQTLLSKLEDAAGSRLGEMTRLTLDEMWSWREGYVK